MEGNREKLILWISRQSMNKIGYVFLPLFRCQLNKKFVHYIFDCFWISKKTGKITFIVMAIEQKNENKNKNQHRANTFDAHTHTLIRPLHVIHINFWMSALWIKRKTINARFRWCSLRAIKRSFFQLFSTTKSKIK